MAVNLRNFSLHGFCKVNSNFKISSSYARARTLTTQRASVSGYNSYVKELRKTWPAISSGFKERLPGFIDDLQNQIHDREIGQWLKTVVEYQMQGGLQSKVLYTIGIWSALKDHGIFIEEERAWKLAFLCEVFNTIHVSFDDLSENSEFRRGKLCWYRKPDVGLKSIDDYMLFFAGFRQLLSTYFNDHKAYKRLQDIFIEAHHSFAIGQTMEDLYLTGTSTFDDFTFDMFKIKCIEKTAKVAHLPRCNGIMLLGDLNLGKQKEAQVNDVLLEIGYLYQIQNDFFDIHFDEKDTGKRLCGEDIAGGKFSWCLGKALELASKEQRGVLETHYGKPDRNSVNKVMNIYTDLDMAGEYKKLENVHINIVIDKINGISGVPIEIFYNAMSVIYSWINTSVDIQ